MKEINFSSRKKEYKWLSNFYESPMVINGVTYPTNEHFYQSQKYLDKEVRKWVRLSPKPRYLVCLRLRMYDMVDNWKDIKFDIMLKGLREKFLQNEELKQKLLNTGESSLHEDTKNKTWGKGGKDMLGKLLTQIRSEIKQMEDNHTNLYITESISYIIK